MTVRLIAVVIVGALAAPSAAAQDSAAALQAAFVASVEAENADALAALYAENADSYMTDGSVARGRAAIGASWAGFFDAFDGFSLTLEQQGERAMGENHAAWGLWTMSATPAEGGGLVVWRGRFTDISVKTAQGWRYIVDHASMTTPAGE